MRKIESKWLALLIIVVGVVAAGLLPSLARSALGVSLPYVPESLLAAAFGYLALWLLSQVMDPQAISGPVRKILPKDFLSDLERLYAYEAEAQSVADTLDFYRIPNDLDGVRLAVLTDEMKGLDRAEDPVDFYADRMVAWISGRYKKRLEKILKAVFDREVARDALDDELAAVIAKLHRARVESRPPSLWVELLDPFLKLQVLAAVLVESGQLPPEYREAAYAGIVAAKAGETRQSFELKAFVTGLEEEVRQCLSIVESMESASRLLTVEASDLGARGRRDLAGRILKECATPRRVAACAREIAARHAPGRPGVARVFELLYHERQGTVTPDLWPEDGEVRTALARELTDSPHLPTAGLDARDLEALLKELPVFDFDELRRQLTEQQKVLMLLGRMAAILKPMLEAIDPARPPEFLEPTARTRLAGEIRLRHSPNDRRERCARVLAETFEGEGWAERLGAGNVDQWTKVLSILSHEREGAVPADLWPSADAVPTLAALLVRGGRFPPAWSDLVDLEVVEKRLGHLQTFDLDRFRADLEGRLYKSRTVVQQLASALGSYDPGFLEPELRRELIRAFLKTEPAQPAEPFQFCAEEIARRWPRHAAFEGLELDSLPETLLWLSRERFGAPAGGAWPPAEPVLHNLARIVPRSDRIPAELKSLIDLETLEARLLGLTSFKLEDLIAVLQKDLADGRATVDHVAAAAEHYGVARLDEARRDALSRELLSAAHRRDYQPTRLCARRIAAWMFEDCEQLGGQLDQRHTAKDPAMVDTLERFAVGSLGERQRERLTTLVKSSRNKSEKIEELVKVARESFEGLDRESLSDALELLFHERADAVPADLWRPPPDALAALARLLKRSRQPSTEHVTAGEIELLLGALAQLDLAQLTTELEAFDRLRRSAESYRAFLGRHGLAETAAPIPGAFLIEAVRSRSGGRLPDGPETFDRLEAATFEVLQRTGVDAIRGWDAARAAAAADHPPAMTEVELRGHGLLSLILFLSREEALSGSVRREACVALAAGDEAVPAASLTGSPPGVEIAWAYLEEKREFRRGNRPADTPFLRLDAFIPGWRSRIEQQPSGSHSFRRELDELRYALRAGSWLNSKEELVKRALFEFVPEAERRAELAAADAGAARPRRLLKHIPGSKRTLQQLFSRLELGTVARFVDGFVETKTIMPYVLTVRAEAGPLQRLLDFLITKDPDKRARLAAIGVELKAGDKWKYNFKRYTLYTRIGLVPPGMGFDQFCELFKRDFKRIVDRQDELLKPAKDKGAFKYRVEEYEILIHAFNPAAHNPFDFGEPAGTRPAMQRIKQLFAEQLTREELYSVLHYEGKFETDTRVSLADVIIQAAVSEILAPRSDGAARGGMLETVGEHIRKDFLVSLGGAIDGPSLRRRLRGDPGLRAEAARALSAAISRHAPSLALTADDLAEAYLELVEQADAIEAAFLGELRVAVDDERKLALFLEPGTDLFDRAAEVLAGVIRRRIPVLAGQASPLARVILEQVAETHLSLVQLEQQIGRVVLASSGDVGPPAPVH